MRSVFPVHKFDNALGGTAFDDGATGLLVNAGNKYATGEWWHAEPCAPGAEADNDADQPRPGNQASLYAVLGAGPSQPLLDGDLPVYPPGPLCNPKGLTSLGAHLINGMADRGMIVETDHMSVKARQRGADDPRGRAATPGVITSHSWGDGTSQRASSASAASSAPYARRLADYVGRWREARAGRARAPLRRRLRLGHERPRRAGPAAARRRAEPRHATRSAPSTAARS